MQNIAPAPPRNMFTRLGPNKVASDLRKEAKRVGYNVEKDDMSFRVTDPENNNAQVVKGIRIRPNFWAITYFRPYWEENA